MSGEAGVRRPSPVVVREARPEEYRRIGELTVAAYLGLPDGHQHPAYLERLRDVATRAREAVVLAAVDDDGAVLGGVTYVPRPGPWAEFEADDEAGLRALAVEPAAQGRGIGRALVAACIERARAADRRALTLMTRPSMTTAQRLYERLGFARDRAGDWEFEPGEWLWAYRLDLRAASGSTLATPSGGIADPTPPEPDAG